MSRLSTFYQSGRLAISFELFPPKTPKGEDSLYEHVEKLLEYSPDFVTCTYGAGGSTRDKTLEIVTRVKNRFGVPVASHLTLVGSTVEDLRAYLIRAREQNVDFVVALRGDPPQGQTDFLQTIGGFRYANELVSLLKREFPDFGIAVAGYPETHREATNPLADLENLKRKVDAGADIVITQLFYDNQDFFRFRDGCDKIGIRVPIIPGVLPITNLKQVQRITSLCGARLPAQLINQLASRDDSDWHFQAGVDWSIRQSRELIEKESSGLHFYVLNQSSATLKIMQAIGIDALRGAK
jgi:methylenetetrahydrofolate reductase (NADPH)